MYKSIGMCQLIHYDGFVLKLPDKNKTYHPNEKIEDERLPHFQKGRRIYISAVLWSTDPNEEKITLDPDKYLIPELVPNNIKLEDIKCLTYEQYSDNIHKIELEREVRQAKKLKLSRATYLAKRYQEATGC